MSFTMIECAQGTQEWKEARTGVITASRFRDATETTKKGEATAKAVSYLAQVAIERISGEPSDEGFVTWQMRRGTELEPVARLMYESRSGAFVTEAGIAVTDDGKFGYSTDGLVDDDGLIEIKCVASPEKIIHIVTTGDVSEYIHQMQGGMWITGRKWCDFVLYVPQLRSVGKELFIRRIKRDDDFIEVMEQKLMSFEREVSSIERRLRAPLRKSELEAA